MATLSSRTLKWFAVGALGMVAYLMLTSRDSRSDESWTRGRIRFVEKVHVVRRPFTLLAESGGSAFIPFPYTQRKTLAQQLFVDTTLVWQTSAPALYFADAHPEGRAVVLRSHNDDAPWLIIHDSGAEVSVPGLADTERWREEHPFPFGFWRWTEDGKGIDAYSVGWIHDWVGNNPSVSYVRVWRIEPTDGSHRLLEACQVPYAAKPDFSATPCAAAWRARLAPKG